MGGSRDELPARTRSSKDDRRTEKSVHFFLPDYPHLPRLDEITPDDGWRFFESGRDQWIPYTYLRLREAGHDVRISDDPPVAGIAVVFASDLRQLLRRCTRRTALTIVAAQADRRIPELLLADVLVQHNAADADGRQRFFIPNWPQAGLIGRDPDRGPAIRTVSYKGRLLNLAPEFLSSPWNDFLAERNLEFRIETDSSEPIPGHLPMSNIRIDRGMRWNDYSDVDLVFAVRPVRTDLHPHKPGLKLTNAWQAGVPALVGPELGYRELVAGPLDCLEVSSLSDAMVAVDRLRDDPCLYDEMVAVGRTRAEEFTVDAVRTRWEELLLGRLADWRPNPIVQLTRRPAAPVRRLARRTRRAIRHRLQRPPVIS